mgnify:CR=1 FL=1
MIGAVSADRRGGTVRAGLTGKGGRAAARSLRSVYCGIVSMNDGRCIRRSTYAASAGWSSRHGCAGKRKLSQPNAQPMQTSASVYRPSHAH